MEIYSHNDISSPGKWLNICLDDNAHVHHVLESATMQLENGNNPHKMQCKIVKWIKLREQKLFLCSQSVPYLPLDASHPRYSLRK